MKKKFFIFLLIISSLFIILLYNNSTHKKKKNILFTRQTYKIGDILIDIKKREISFPAYIQKNTGWVQFLIYLEGYKWLKKDTAIVSCANLQHLQNAIALLDWKIWDDIWYRTKKHKFNIFIKYKDREIPSHSLILSNEYLYPEEIIFFGSPYFDEIVFSNTENSDCKKCPVYLLEKKTLQKLFKRETGKSGYLLNSKTFPPLHKKVVVIIRMSK